MRNYNGVIIEESLDDKSVLKEVKILKTKIEKVTQRHQTPWVNQWTLHSVEINEKNAEEVAEKIAKALDKIHSWYADFKSERFHYIIFRNKVFKIDIYSKEQYDEAKKYGIFLGIPEYQVNFHPEIKE